MPDYRTNTVEPSSITAIFVVLSSSLRLQTLKEIGAVRNTLIVFTSDGGHLWGEHGLIDKRCAYEESIRIPLIAHWPDLIKPASRCGAIVANIDVAPTLLEIADVTLPDHMDGQSFRRLLSDPEADQRSRDSLLYEYYWEPAFPQTPTTFALRGRRYKLIQYHGIWDMDELYDLENDPTETTNSSRNINHVSPKCAPTCIRN